MNQEKRRKDDRKAWFVFKPDTNQVPVWKDLDLSFLLDAPAGKHGFAKNIKGQIVFEDGTRGRFWGVDLVASRVFVSHEEASRIAERLASIGCNMVRLHHMDAAWAKPNIFGNDPDSTRSLSEDSLDKLDFLVSELVKRGIYIYMDLLVHRKLRRNDGLQEWEDLPNGLKGLAHFNKPVIELQKEYARQLFTHYNPYLKKKYVDVPAIIATEAINESSLFWVDRQSDLPDRFRKELDGLFNDWLLKKYGSQESLSAEWEKAGQPELSKEESLAQKNIRRARLGINDDNWIKNALSPDGPARTADTRHFYYELQNAYYHEMEAFLRSIGYKGLFTGSNHWERIDADILSNLFDDIDRHSYYDHPDTSKGWGMLDIRFRNTPVTKDERNNIAELASSRVMGLPFLVGEWNIPFNNEYRAQGPVIMSVYACLQNWDALLQFDFLRGQWNEKIDDLFDISESPVVMAQWAVASLLFHGGYIRPAEHTLVDSLGTGEVFHGMDSSYRIVGGDLGLPLICGVSKKFTNTSAGMFADASEMLGLYKKGKTFKSDTGELSWDMDKGVLVINSPTVQGIVGFPENNEFEFTDIRIQASTKFCSIIMISLDGNPLSVSKRMVLVTSARDANSDMQYNASRTGFLDLGIPPILVEPVRGSMSFKDREGLIIRTADANGIFLGKTRDTGKKNSTFTLEQNTFFYEISTKP